MKARCALCYFCGKIVLQGEVVNALFFVTVLNVRKAERIFYITPFKAFIWTMKSNIFPSPSFINRVKKELVQKGEGFHGQQLRWDFCIQVGTCTSYVPQFVEGGAL